MRNGNDVHGDNEAEAAKEGHYDTNQPTTNSLHGGSGGKYKGKKTLGR